MAMMTIQEVVLAILRLDHAAEGKLLAKGSEYGLLREH